MFDDEENDGHDPLLPGSLREEKTSLRGIDRALTTGSLAVGRSARDFNYNDLLRAQKNVRKRRSVDQEAQPEGLGEGNKAHGHDGPLPWYKPPAQRQLWGEEQALAHVDWAELFFDLFYVSGAYNMAALLASALNKDDWLRGILYYLGTFGALWGAWEQSMFMKARYADDDVTHRAIDVVRQLCVGLATCFITKIDYLGDSETGDAMMFLFFILIELLLQLLLCAELWKKGIGDREAIENFTLTTIKAQLLPKLVLYLTAFTVAAIPFFSQHSDDYDTYRDEKSRNDGYKDDGNDGYKDDGDTHDSKAEALWKLCDLPLTLLAASYLLANFTEAWQRLKLLGKRGGNIRDSYVPTNIDYAIHRYAEWTMLMLGEGILSLCTVDVVHNGEYYVVIIFGILTMMSIAVVKFESEPSHGDDHAMWRNLDHSLCFRFFIQLLSLFLIAFGGTYKNFLKHVVKDEEPDSGYPPKLGEVGNQASRLLYSKTELTEEWAAGFFSISLAMVMISLELISRTHKDVKYQLRTLRLPYFALGTVLRVGLVLFVLTSFLWTTDPSQLTFLGFGAVELLMLTRLMTHFVHRLHATKLVDTV